MCKTPKLASDLSVSLVPLQDPQSAPHVNFLLDEFGKWPNQDHCAGSLLTQLQALAFVVFALGIWRSAYDFFSDLAD